MIVIGLAVAAFFVVRSKLMMGDGIASSENTEEWEAKLSQSNERSSVVMTPELLSGT